MFINIKYLVITVISIFLSLGIGILIGIQINSQDIIFEQQEITVQKMENKFDELNRINISLQNQLKQISAKNELNENYIKTIFPDYIKNKLLDLHIVIIETTDDYTYTSMRQAINLAGAQVSSLNIINEKIFNLTDDERRKIADYFQVEENEIILTVLKTIASNVAGSYNTEEINLLIDMGIIYVNGDLQVPADYVVLAGGSKEKNNNHEIIDLPLIKELKKKSLPIIGVETSDTAYSYIDFYKQEKLSTIDNVDTIIGQTSLIFVLNGREGNYGIKKSAASLMPFVDKEEDSN